MSGFRLSPIPEKERSSPDSVSLPDLVVEPAPDRHDDPPEFYEGLERRMKRLYRQLFLGEHESEVEMAKSSSVDDEENPKLIESRSINESNYSNKTDDDPNVDIEAYGNKQSYDKDDNHSDLTKGDRSIENGENVNEIYASNIDETKSDDTEKISTGIKNTLNRNKDGIDVVEDCFVNTVRGLFTSKVRKTVFLSSSDESLEDLEPIANDEEVEVMREASVTAVNVGNERWSWQEEAGNQDSSKLAFETQTSFRLSPIPEEERSSPDSVSLPDLVVEPAPDRHDDPPEFYEGLERRMKRLYRQLFLGEHESEVEMAKSSSVDDDEKPKLIESRSINESNYSNKTDDDPNVDIEAYGNKQSYDKDDNHSDLTKGDRSIENGENLNEIYASKIDETKSDSKDTALCHRLSTTTAEINETRPERRSTQAFDKGSPVLMTRLLQSSSIRSRKSDESFNVSEASEEFIRRLSSHKSDASNTHEDNIEKPETQVQRLLRASDLKIASLDSKKKLDTIKLVDYSDTDENSEEDDVRKKYDTEDITLLLPSEITRARLDSNKTDDTEKISTDIKNTLNRNKDGTDVVEDCFVNTVRGLFTSKVRKTVFLSSSDESLEDLEPIAKDEEVEVMREASVTAVNGGNERWSWQEEAGNQDSSELAFETQINAVKIVYESSNSAEISISFEETEDAIENANIDNQHNVANIFDEFSSVSPIDVDIEESPQVSRSKKRRTNSEEDAPSKRRKKDVAIQTDKEEDDMKWEDIRPGFFVGSPLVYRLCRCKDHVCS